MSRIGLSRTNKRKHLDSTFVAKKGPVKLKLRQALTQVHISFDLWTSPNHHTVLGVSAHFLDEKGLCDSNSAAIRAITWR
ncbi:hypothetical protein E4U23_003846 [Claviceps purpurea]|nr:hypothetical protein E4U23_003846 [Claviceps purpurea]